MPQTKICRQCQTNFEIRDEDLKFYEKISPTFNGKKYLISPPSLCPDCRRQLRLSFRNERLLYPRKCDKTGENILSVYSPLSKHKVYSHKEWWKDDWDSLSYGIDVDFSRPFFEQLKELNVKVPRLSLNVVNCENSDYVNQCGYSRNCYLSFNSDYSEQCYYSTTALHSKDCMDVFDVSKCEMCYMSVALGDCYNASFSFQCKSCHDIMFCRDCIGCGDCFGCINLRNKNYCYYNEQLSREAYMEKIKQLELSSFKNIQNIQKLVNDFFLKHPHKFASITQCENSIGDYLVNSKNAYMCFDSFNNQDVAYCSVTSGAKDTVDFDVGGYDCELCCNIACSGDNIYHSIFGVNHWGRDRECIFCDIMISCSNCFGCVGLRNKEYCILNKQYTKDQYENIVVRILERMQKDGVWGEFFPPSLSPYGYNESVANEYYPLNKEQASAKGYNWSDYVIPKPNASRIIPSALLPDNIKEIPADIVSAAVECEVTGKLFRIIPQELKFLKEHNFPLPRRHPDQRHRDRLAIRNPRKLWKRACMKCRKEVMTTFAPDRKEIVYCDDCYLKEVY